MTDAQRDWRVGIIALAVFGAFILGYMVAIHQTENLVAGGVTFSNQEKGTLAAAAPPALPDVVREYLIADCIPVDVASALSQAEALAQSAKRATDEMRYLMHLTEANAMRLRVVACVDLWSR